MKYRQNDYDDYSYREQGPAATAGSVVSMNSSLITTSVT
ncbi:hypothetical protein A3L23_03845 [Rhodococcoides fascians D188]|nr:hypothetical protein A3L23_03845 [Rhodococcus fascians D188]